MPSDEALRARIVELRARRFASAKHRPVQTKPVKVGRGKSGVKEKADA